MMRADPTTLVEAALFVWALAQTLPLVRRMLQIGIHRSTNWHTPMVDIYGLAIIPLVKQVLGRDE